VERALKARRRGSGARIARMILEQYSILLLVIAASAVFSLFNPRFLTLENLVNLSRQIVPLGIIALGASFVIIGGGLDLSAGVGATMCGAALGVIFVVTKNVALSLAVGLGTGLVIGTLNAVLITQAGFGAVIVTLAVMTMLQGGIQLLLAGRIVFLSHPVFQFISRGAVAGVPVTFLFLVAVFLLSYYLLNHTRFGVYLYAVGGSARNAEVVGIRVQRIRFITFLLSGLLMAISGIVLVSRLALISPNLSGFPLLLNGVSAAVIGGISVTGGRGKVGGVFLGVVFIGVVSNAINFLNVTPEAQDFFRGLLVVFALIFQQLTIRRGQVDASA
jgi:ribose/xylose/arabinose/galactoside ABC-type transport system permease subunit